LRYPYLHAFLAELINSSRLTKEHDLELVAVGVVVNKVCEFLIGLVILKWNVDGYLRLQVHAVVLNCLQLFRLATYLLE